MAVLSYGAWVFLAVVPLLALTADNKLLANVTDCRDRMGEACSQYPLVGECNQTSGVCNCEFYNETTLIDCFFNNAQENFCQVRECFNFFNSSGDCREGNKKRLTALLLSIFLINFGAANFYIERYDLAVPQIILGLLLCAFQFGSCAVGCKRDDDDRPTAGCIVCCSLNSFLSLLFLAWWIADLVFFATNTRDDGDGCPLYT